MRVLIIALLVMGTGQPVPAKAVKIRGYVTAISSPTTFEIEDYRITRDQTLALEFEKADDQEPVEFRPEDIRVGTELEIAGEYNEATGELKARSVRVFLEEAKKLKRTALIEKRPALEMADRGWRGILVADGQKIRIEPRTTVVLKPNASERKALKAAKKPPAVKGQEDDTGEPVQSLDAIGPNTFISYEGYRQEDGSIAAVKIEFLHNELEQGEAKLWKTLTPKVKEPLALRGKPGELQINQVGKFKLVPNEEAQQYVRKLGDSLVPAWQKSLPDSDPNKIPFRFYLAQSKVANAFALANGTVVVFSPLFELLESEAQLAAVVGHEIAHATQEHTRRQLSYHRKKLFALQLGAAVAAGFGAYTVRDIANLVEAAVRTGYSRSLENQADRVGLEYMIASGYDPREAPRVWKVMTRKYGDQPTNFFWSSHDNHTTRRSYLMAELKNNYPALDWPSFRKHDGEFQRIAALLREPGSKPQKIKVKY